MARQFSASQTDNQTKVGTLGAALETVGPFRYRRATGPGTLTLVLSGTWEGTVLLQASIPDVGQWVTLATFVDNAAERLVMDGSIDIRVYCSAYTSGTCYAGVINQ